jgi:hypothetical protein
LGWPVLFQVRGSMITGGIGQSTNWSHS